MLLILIGLFTQSFGQTINCSFPGVSFNSSFLGVVQNPQQFISFSHYVLTYINGTYIVEAQVVNGSPVFLDAAFINNTQSNNPNFDCYQKVTWLNASLNAEDTCMAYSVIPFGANAFAYVGCYDYGSTQCPTACTPQYVLGNNRTFFGRFYLNNLNNDERKIKNALINHQKFRESASVSCDIVKGYNATTISYNMSNSTEPVVYSLLYSNGTYIQYTYNGAYYASGTYNISASTSSDVECNMYIMFEDVPESNKVQCSSFSLAMNGSARVGCTSKNETCPTSCNPQFVSKPSNLWWASIGLNAIG